MLCGRRSPSSSPAPLLAAPGFGPLTAGKLIGEIAGAHRFSSDAKLARASGIAPIPVSSGKTNRHHLDRGGTETRDETARSTPRFIASLSAVPAATLARKRSEGKSAAKRSAASSATSPAAFGTSSSRPTRSEELRSSSPCSVRSGGQTMRRWTRRSDSAGAVAQPADA